ncbi:MAG: M20/M25/M40 family metallo-hydrolase [Anaerolineae bacterium]|jgi:endoglucanase|nr:M20/M25/M40 family metallo-hydrolase [Anaerolineae bacterium]
MHFLKELSEAVGVSGDESAVRSIVLRAIQPYVSDVQVDSLGTVTARQAAAGGGAALRVLLAAHMDEVGFMVTGFESSGLLRFTAVGGIDDRILPGLRVRVGRKGLPGVIVWTPIHRNQDNGVKPLKDLRIDIGATGKGGAEGQVKRGDRIAFDSAYGELGSLLVRGKAFDDRVGCSLLIDVLAGGPYPVELLPAFTVQEEIGLRGARVTAQRLTPDVALVLEGTTANDIPDPLADPDEPTVDNPACKLGHGPVLTVIDSSMITAPRLLAFIRQTATAAGIPWQLKTAPGGGTDAGRIHLAAGGIPSAVISMPCRYIHSPTAYLHRQDYTATLHLIQSVLRAITAADFQPV